MFAIVDYRVDKEIVKNLKKHVDDIFLFSAKDITYNSVEGHPDIFIYQDEDNIVIAPNAPDSLFNFLHTNNIEYTIGLQDVGHSLENSTLYNAVATPYHLLHKKWFTDEQIIELNRDKIFINLPNAYARCSLFTITNKQICTSDIGIKNALLNNNFDVIYFDPSEIKLFGHSYGFIGGTTGEVNNKFFFLGNILKHQDGRQLEKALLQADKEIICLSNNYLYDGGRIIFLK